MNYEAMIDDLNIDYRFFLQECSIEAIPYNALNEGAIIDTIKKVFGAIIDFIKGLIDKVVGFFTGKKGDNEKAKDLKNLANKAKTSGPGKFTKTYTYYVLKPETCNAFTKYCEDEIKKAENDLSKIQSSYRKYINTGEGEPQIEVKNKDNVLTTDFLIEKTADETNLKLSMEIQNHISNITSSMFNHANITKSFKDMLLKYNTLIKDIEKEFMKEKDNPKISERLQYIVQILNDENKHFGYLIQDVSILSAAHDKSIKSLEVILNAPRISED